MIDEPAHGTFQWVLGNDFIEAWLSNQESSLLWIRGAPGQGKTVLSKFILDQLESQPANRQQPANIIYFFFYDQNEQFQSVLSLLRSLIKQLLKQNGIWRHITGLSEVEPSEESLWEVLEEVIRAPVLHTIYCVVDATDECKGDEARSKLLRRIKRLIAAQKSKSLPVLKILLTSRPTVDIGREMDGCPCMDLKTNSDDLRILIDSKIAALTDFDDDLRGYTSKLLLASAGRTFLWVSIVLKKLKATTLASRAIVEKIVAESPTDLDQLYNSIIGPIMKGSQQEQRILAWVVYGRRPLSLTELEAALATQMDSRNEKSTHDHKVSLTQDKVTSAMGIIVDIIDNRVHLIHQSAKDFLIKNQQLSGAEFCNGLDPNIYLAKICMIYLTFEDFETGPCGERATLETRRHQFPLYDYAAHNWHVHIRSEDEIDDNLTILRRLTEPGSAILLSWGEAAGIRGLQEVDDAWGVAMKTDIKWSIDDQNAYSVITEEKVNEAAKNGAKGYEKIEAFARRGDTVFTEAASHAIAANFDEGMLRVLLERHGSVMVTPELMEAAASNRNTGTSVLRLLLKLPVASQLTERIVRVAAENSEHGKHIIELFLRKENLLLEDGAIAALVELFDAEVLMQIPHGMSIEMNEQTVAAAAMNRKSGREILVLLLDRRPCKTKITGRMVQILARTFDREILGMLLDKGGEGVVVTDEVVKAAVGNVGSGKEVMTLLLDKRGADMIVTEEMVKLITGNFGEEVITLLLNKRGADVVVTEEVVIAAAANSNIGEKMMTLLFDKRGADVVVTEEIVKAAAANWGSGKEVMMLLFNKCGGDIVVTEEVVKAAAANWKSGKEVITLLLDKRGADIVVTEGMVKLITRKFGKEIITLLINKRGADVVVT
jgi:dephospho-CoA kinase